ncbi:hypothetical protein yc1106_07243 [Curvularia clavata]|uniref:Uncharacterized protein n=1 Tax=Curvularia clavata TaxID=95742 RepID=A0A9Q8ZEF4_CURCL|nr:hypothetical protein yc1106_07243 [Curvularia clavata]
MQRTSTGSSGTEQAVPPTEVDKTSTKASPRDLHSQSILRDASDISNDASRASTLISDVIRTAKTAADNALSWAEKKAVFLHSEKEKVGPYSSPATCMLSDLDAIANGILPAMPTKSQLDESTVKQGKDSQDRK